MEASQSAQPEDAAPAPLPHPSYRQLLNDGIPVAFNACMDRLFWPLEGAFPEAISVMKHARGSKEELDPLHRSATDGDATTTIATTTDDDNGIWHECAAESVTIPKVSSIEVAARELEQWESDWVAWHETAHRDSSDADQQFVAYGDLDDDVRPFRMEGEEDGNWEEDSDKEFLVACCGTRRPLRKKGQVLVVVPAPGGDFVTLRDFVGAVHPWLMSMRDDFVNAKAVARWEQFPESTRWMVSYRGLIMTSPAHGGGEGANALEERQTWIREHGPPRAADEAWKARFMAKIGRG